MEQKKSENGETGKQVNNLVIDSSVVIKWFSQEEDTIKALKIRSNFLRGGVTMVVPDIQLYEIANALRYNKIFSKKDIKEAVNSLIDLGINIFVPTKDVLERAVELSYKFNISFYDAYFVALATTLNFLLITADEKLYDKLKTLRFVKLLQDLEL